MKIALILTLPYLFVFLYVFASLFLNWPRPLTIRVCSVLLVLAISLKYIFYWETGNSFNTPDLPIHLELVTESLFNALTILFFMLLFKDIMVFVLWVSRHFGISSWRFTFSPHFRPFFVLAAVVLGMVGTWQAMRIPGVHTIDIRLSGLPRNLDGISIVQLTDLHVGPLLKRSWLEGVVRKTNSLHPEIVVLTGDMIDGFAENDGGELEPLAELRSVYGIYGVTGNHEYYFRPREWCTFFEKRGIVMLNNEHRVLTINGEKLVIAGVPDYAGVRFGNPGPDVDMALQNAPGTVRILLKHQPRGSAYPAERVDLQLSGHTHGGQLFFLKPIVGFFNGGLVDGVYRRGKTLVYVSPGAGVWSGFSCRLGTPSEITRIILRSPEIRE